MPNDGKTLIKGTAAEHLVCADLLLLGYNTFIAPQICKYDVVSEIDGNLIRFQVKSVYGLRPNTGRRQRTQVYQFSIRKRNRAVYQLGDFDIVALVALDTKRIAYIRPDGNLNGISIRVNDDKKSGKGVYFRGGGQNGRVFAEYTLNLALANLSTMSIRRNIGGQNLIY